VILSTTALFSGSRFRLTDHQQDLRLVPVSQARSGVPDFDRSCSWWVVGNDGRRYRHLYFCPTTGECGTRTDLNLKLRAASDGRGGSSSISSCFKTRYALRLVGAPEACRSINAQTQKAWTRGGVTTSGRVVHRPRSLADLQIELPSKPR